MKRLLHKVQPILDELLDNGQGTRMEIFNRTDISTGWEEFKRLIGMLTSQGLIEIVAIPGTIQTGFDLTEEGHEFVHSLRQ